MTLLASAGRSDRPGTEPSEQAPDPPAPLDLRLVGPALATWAAALVGTRSAGWGGRVAAAAAVLAVAWTAYALLRRARPGGWLVPATAACLAAGAASGGLRLVALESGPVPDLARAEAVAVAAATVLGDPRPGRSAGGGPPRAFVTFALRLDEVTARGATVRVRTPVLAVADPSWRGVLPGTPVHVRGRLQPATRDGPVAAVLRLRGGPDVRGPPGVLATATEPVRAALRAAVAGAPAPAGGLVPALVLGDETSLDDGVRADFEVAGLTHLTAVSGANVAIMLAVVLAVARWAGARGVVVPVVGGLAVLGFVALARPEPSVLRAAAMGLVAVAGLSAADRRRGLPALGAAVVVLLLVDPWLAGSYGFVLSVLATAGILVVAPPCRDALVRWLPRPLADAVAVPLAAQVACAPVVAVLSGTVSLVAVPANLLAALAVAPATVLGLLAALVGLVLPQVAGWLGWLAAAAAGWITGVAAWAADLPGATVPWAPSGTSLAVLAAVSAGLTVVLPRLLRRRWLAAGAALVLLVVLVRPVPRPGWPPDGWVAVLCDVGQGDALVLAAGPGAAVVVDTGPDPPLVDRCLDELGVRSVPLVVLTHDHADHVDGLPGVLAGRRVGGIAVGPLDDPAGQAHGVRTAAAAAGVPVRRAVVGESTSVGGLSWDVLWPRWVPDDGSRPNNASLVLLVRTAGLRLLLTGDVEAAAQRGLLAASGADALRADVLKVPHHGSADQHGDLLRAVGARVAVVGVGAGNDYGHPSSRTLDLLASGGTLVGRTDRDGALALVVDADGRLGLVRRGDPLPAPQ